MENMTESCHLVFETDFGVCSLLFRENPFAVTGFLLPDHNELALKAKAPPELWGTPGKSQEALRISEAMIDYFAGSFHCNLCPAWHLVDMGRLTTLEIEVLRAVAQIPYGQVRSYSEIAANVGHPLAYRFVGSTMAKNPFPVLIPCHRVIRNDMSVGNYGGGPEMKKKLIELEAGNALKSNC